MKKQGQPWAKADDELLLALKNQGLQFHEIGEQLGRTACSARKRVERLRWLAKTRAEAGGVSPQPWTSADETALLYMRAAGHTFPEIARKLRRTVRAVQARDHALRREAAGEPRWCGDRGFPRLPDEQPIRPGNSEDPGTMRDVAVIYARRINALGGHQGARRVTGRIVEKLPFSRHAKPAILTGSSLA